MRLMHCPVLVMIMLAYLCVSGGQPTDAMTGVIESLFADIIEVAMIMSLRALGLCRCQSH